jgi:hypothetical protein
VRGAHVSPNAPIDAAIATPVEGDATDVAVNAMSRNVRKKPSFVFLAFLRDLSASLILALVSALAFLRDLSASLILVLVSALFERRSRAMTFVQPMVNRMLLFFSCR